MPQRSVGQPTRWFHVLEADGRRVTATRELAEAQAARDAGAGRRITEAVGTVCDPDGDPIAEQWR